MSRTVRRSGTSRPSAAVAVFARAVVKGRTKTRLIPALGPDGAAEFHRALVSDTLRKVSRLEGKIARYLFVADGAPQAHAVDVVQRDEHGGFVGDHAEVIEAAGGAKNGFSFDALNDAESVIWVNDLVTNLECHTSPIA